MKTPHARVIEVAAVVFDGRGVEVAHFHAVANPGVESLALADPIAMNIHGISLEEIQAAPPSTEVARRLEAFLDEHWGATYHAFNREFDMWFLEQPPWSLPSSKWGECVMLASMEVMDAADAVDRRRGGEPRWPSLFRASRFFGIPQEGSHRALADARTSARIHAKILATRQARAAASEEIHILEQGY